MAPIDRTSTSRTERRRPVEAAPAPMAALRPVVATAAAAMLPAPVASLLSPLASLLLPPPPPPGLTIGARGRKVERAETLLKKAGFAAGPAEGRFTEKTEAALKQFQAATGLPATGRLDDRTFQKLQNVGKRMKRFPHTQGVGQQSEGIKTNERRLQKLGYDVGRVDGVFDARTAEAVKAFKADQKELTSESGLLGQKGRQSLRRESDAMAHDPFHARKRVQGGQQRRHLQRLDARVAEAASRTNAEGLRGFGTGSRGKSVEYVQQHLRAAGFDPKRQDGVFDERTAGALRNYQRREGIPQSGRVDPLTWRHLQKATLEAKTATDPRQTIGERSHAVKETEKLLNKLGFDPGQVDGRYTENTQRALDRFRRRRHLRGVGQGVGPNTLEQLKKAVRDMNPFGEPRTVRAYNDGHGYNIKVVRVGGKYVAGGEAELVRADMAKAFKRMYDAARRDGVDLRVVDGFRTMSEQQYLYNLYLSGRGNPANPPGYSEHQNGRALDFNVQTNGNDAVGVGTVYNWLARNGGRFGFHRIPSEAWHWEYRP